MSQEPLTANLLLLAAALFLTSCAQKSSEVEATPGVNAMPEETFSVSLVPEEQPKFVRLYKANIGAFKIECKAKNWYYGSGRYWTGELTQADGRWILFDPERVADKIIDRDLAPKVQAMVDQFFEADGQFLKSQPSEYVDEKGQRWVRR